MRKIIGSLLIVLLVLVGCSSEPSNESKPEAQIVVEKKEYSVGETAEIDGLKVTLNSVRNLEGDDIISPDEGTEWIVVDFTFENTNDESKYVGGIFEITMRDGDGREKDQNIWGDLEGSVDGDIPAGEKLSGEKSFVIKGDEESLYVYYKPSFSTKDAIKFVVK